MPWYKLLLPAEQCGLGGKMMEIQRAFEKEFISHGMRFKGAVMCSNRSADFSTHFFYFSPEAATIAPDVIFQYGATECPQPHMTDDMRLCVGHVGVLPSLLLPKPDTD